MTRTTLEQAVYRDFGYADAPVAAISNRIQGYLNDRHRRLLAMAGMEKFRLETQSFSLTASTSTYALDMPIQKVLKVADTTNRHALEQRSLDWWRRVDPSPNTGTQEYWIPLRWGPALRNIGGTGLWIVSTSASDTIACHVETIDTTGALTTNTVTTSGTTRVTVPSSGAATNHQRLVRFSATSAPVGNLELYDAATAGNKVGIINVGRTAAQSLTIVLWPTPAAADTLQVDYIHYIRDFTVGYDEPQLPVDFHYLVAVGAKIDEAHKRGDARLGEWKEEWVEGIRNLRDFASNYTDTVIIPGISEIAGRSNLGSAYPSGIW